jgi:hypothetical protein
LAQKQKPLFERILNSCAKSTFAVCSLLVANNRIIVRSLAVIIQLRLQRELFVNVIESLLPPLLLTPLTPLPPPPPPPPPQQQQQQQQDQLEEKDGR